MTGVEGNIVVNSALNAPLDNGCRVEAFYTVEDNRVVGNDHSASLLECLVKHRFGDIYSKQHTALEFVILTTDNQSCIVVRLL